MMTGPYSPRLDKGSWVTSLYNLPRWFSATAYHDLFDYIPLTDAVSVTQKSLPTLLYPLTAASTPASGSTLQRLCEVFSSEHQQLLVNIQSLKPKLGHGFNTTDPSYVWTCYYDKEITSIKILSASGYVTISRASNELELFQSADWRWYWDTNNILFISGLDLLEHTTAASGWQYVGQTTLWESSQTLYFQHPTTYNWIPVHPEEISSGGFLNYYSSTPLKLRNSNSVFASGFPTIDILINGVANTATKNDIWNSLDEKGLISGIPRRYAETNINYSVPLLLNEWFGGQTISGFTNYLAIQLRSGTTSSVSASATGFNLPSGCTNYTVKNLNNFNYITENSLIPDPNTSNLFISRYAVPTLGQAFLNNTTISYSTSGTLYYLNTKINNKNNTPIFQWKVSYYSQVASTVVFSSNLPTTISDLLIFFTSNVQVITPDATALKTSFKRTSPIFRWKENIEDIPDTITFMKGLSVFI